jgi:chromosomal replication initiation ATPase DnaA
VTPSQLPLPLGARSALSRADLIVAPSNERAVAFIDSWPDWPVVAAALHGPRGCGKSHLAAIWQDMSGAHVIPASQVSLRGRRAPIVIEDVDSATPTMARDSALFAILESAARGAEVLLTGAEPPQFWPAVLPDLGSRFAALVTFPLWALDETMLAALARKLFEDRQLAVPDVVIERMIHLLERSPGAVRDFVARADAAALARSRPINLALVRELISEEEGGTP